MIDLSLMMFGGGGGGSGLTYDNKGWSQKITSKIHIGGSGTYVLFDSHGKPKMKTTGTELKAKIEKDELVYNEEIDEWETKKGTTYTIRKRKK